jgi:medium-chain acyl-[acyl-carrier-protein] hydrolase
MITTFEKTFRVHGYELDFQGKIQPIVLLNYLQEVASEHAAKLGFSVISLREKNLTWVLSRYHVQIHRYPGYGENIYIKTWPSAAQGLFALRDFEMLDEKENKILAATSSWIMLDYQKKRPIQLDAFLPNFPTYGKRALVDKFLSLPTVEKPIFEFSFQVRMSDLDLNQHVNHTSYIHWAIETAPEDILQTKRLIKIESGFKAEAFYKDKIISKVQPISNNDSTVFVHQLFNEKNNTELTRLRTEWK